MEYYLSALKKYAVFEGRAPRAEYWFFYLFNFFAFAVLTAIGLLANLGSETPFGLFSTLYSLAVLLPGVAVSVRRLHDVGKSGWMLFITLIPFIGPIWFLVMALSDSQPGENQYGPNPKGINI